VCEAAELLASQDFEKEFEFGLDVMLEGLEAFLQSKQRA
jgi:hypothetical protein